MSNLGWGLGALGIGGIGTAALMFIPGAMGLASKAAAGAVNFVGNVNWAKVWWIPVGIAIVIYVLILKGEVRHRDKVIAAGVTALSAEKRAHATDLANIRQKTAQAQADDKAHAVAVEQQQVQVTQQKVSAYVSQIEDLRRRYASAVSVRGPGSTPAAGQGGGGHPTVPGIPDAPGGTSLSPETGSFNCEANSIQLRALIDWIESEKRLWDSTNSASQNHAQDGPSR